MSRMALFNSPFLLGFEAMERALDRAAKLSSDGYPPYNIEQTGPETLRISLAVAGFGPDDLDVSVEDRQLVVRGRRAEEGEERVFLHRGIAARHFQRCFVLADGIEIEGARLEDGLLHISMHRPPASAGARRIAIQTAEGRAEAGGE